MNEQNQALPSIPPPIEARGAVVAAPGVPSAAEFEPLRDPFEGGSPEPAPRIGPDATRGLTAWLLLLLVFGVGGMLLGMSEAAALVALAGLFIAAQAADLDPRFRLLYWMLTWVVPAASALAFAGIGTLAVQSPLAPHARALLVAYCAAAAAACVLVALRPVGDPIAVRLFREDPPSHSLRLTLRLAVAGLLLALPGSLLLRDQIAQYVDDSGALLSTAGLAGQLVGMVILALAAVGFLVRRDLRGTLQRLGLERLTLRHLLIAGVGAGVLYLLNDGTDRIQRMFFHHLWAQDRAMVAMMSKNLGLASALLLGVSAGVGEELTLRGALQPRLGLVLTSALFAALHVQYSWFGMVVILLFGLLLGALRSRTSTTVAILVHAIYDILAVMSG